MVVKKATKKTTKIVKNKKNTIEELDLNNIEIDLKEYNKDSDKKLNLEKKEKGDKIPVAREDDKRRAGK
jgi:hypothetical protein